MTEPLRRAGWGRLADGAGVTWTISEGRRGRRWREVVADGALVRHALLLETDPSRRFTHLELASAAGLWTFHPEAGGTLHGNHVDPGTGEVTHTVGVAFGIDDLLIVGGSAIGAASIAWALADVVAPGTTVGRIAHVLDPADGLAPPTAVRIERLTATRWRIDHADPIEVDPRGVPFLDDAGQAPLEVG